MVRIISLFLSLLHSLSLLFYLPSAVVIKSFWKYKDLLITLQNDQRLASCHTGQSHWISTFGGPWDESEPTEPPCSAPPEGRPPTQDPAAQDLSCFPESVFQVLLPKDILKNRRCQGCLWPWIMERSPKAAFQRHKHDHLQLALSNSLLGWDPWAAGPPFMELCESWMSEPHTHRFYLISLGVSPETYTRLELPGNSDGESDLETLGGL